MSDEKKYPTTRLSKTAIDRADAMSEAYGSRAAALDAAVELLAAPCEPHAARTLALPSHSFGPAAAITQALEAWAHAVEDTQAGLDNLIGGPEEWCLIADACQSCEMLEPGWSSPGTYLSAEVFDAHRLNGTGGKWLKGGRDKIDRQVSALCDTLRHLTYLQGWAVVYALRWFWSQPQVPADAEWWLPSWRAGFTPPAV